jgi:hypothetical protein
MELDELARLRVRRMEAIESVTNINSRVDAAIRTGVAKATAALEANRVAAHTVPDSASTKPLLASSSTVHLPHRNPAKTYSELRLPSL